jgi:guanylate kinase
MLYALCGESGAGKTTLQKAVLRRQPLLGRLITSTTRMPRPEEVNHEDYHFLSVLQFQSAVQEGRIVCPIQYRGEWYGTAREDLDQCTRRDKIAVLRPDKLHELQEYTTLIGIYIFKARQDLPPSQDDQIILDHRCLCHYHITNVPGDIEVAVNEILAIIHTYSGGQLI